MMNRSVALACALTMTMIVVVSLPVSTQPKATEPFAAYKEYLDALAKATTLEALLPYYTKELSDGLRKMPKDMQGNYLKMNKREIRDLKVTKQTVDANKAEFHLTGKDAAGNDLTGSATLVKEGGGWRIDDFAWVGPPAKGEL
jgi:hypothetical protein